MMQVRIGDQRMPARFWSRVSPDPSGCWEWTGPRYPAGYGQWHDERSHVAHRSAYIALVGAVPRDLVVDHVCRNRACVNPAHLEAVTQSENIRRGMLPYVNVDRQHAKTHCAKGHPFDELNTRVRGNGSRVCRTCEAAWHKQKRARRKAGDIRPVGRPRMA